MRAVFNRYETHLLTGDFCLIKLEELKKKQKKKNKKKDTKKEDKEDKEEKPKSDDKKEPEATEPEELKDVKPEAAEPEESKDTKPETKDEPKDVKPEEDLKESVESLPKDDTSLAADTDKESAVTSENIKEEKDTPTVASPIPVSTPSKLEARIKELETKLLEANLKISDLESDANTYNSLLQSKPDTEKSTDTDNSLTPASSNDHKLKTQIENLKVENAYLNDKVYSLEARIANMIAANKKRSLDFPNRDGFAGGSDVDSDIGSLSSPIIDAADGAARSGAASQHHPRLSSFAEMDLYGDVNKIKDINKDMQRWSNWTIDIRNWRSLGIGPIFEA